MTARSHSALFLPAAWLALTAGVPTPSLSQPPTLPATAGGWTRADSVGVYAGRDLFRLVDGGADLYVEYGFVRALTSEYTHPPDASVTVELYEMRSPHAAYGLFTSFTVGTGTAVPLGQEAILGDGYCVFWKGVYVGMLTVASDDSAAGTPLLALAGALAEGLHQAGELPLLCSLLRKGGFDSRRMVFVRGTLAVGNQLPQLWASCFPPAEGVVGTSGGFRYVILEYADSAEALAALGGAAAGWQDLALNATVDSLGRWEIRERDEELARVELHGRHLLAVSGGASSASLTSILRKMLETL